MSTQINQIIENKIFFIRNQRVMIDRDLAELYGVETKKLNQAVKRNKKRFPLDFMFQLTNEEQNELVTNCDHLSKLKYSSTNAYAFTEHGVTMLASILNSNRAIEINLQIVRAFIKLRQYIALQNNTIKETLMLHIDNCNRRFDEHDMAIQKIISVLNNLIEHPKETKKIGFNIGE